MVARRALVALAIVVGGAVAAFAVYTFGWHDNTADRGSTRRTDPFVKTVTDATGTHRIYTLRSGDIAVRPGAATQCGAYQEGGFPNLFCTRIGNGRHEVIFYEDSLLVWPLDCRRCGPDGPVFTYRWMPKSIRRCAAVSGSTEGYGLLVKNISCRIGQQIALACHRFTSRQTAICSAVGDRWSCTSTSQDTGPVQRCVAGRKWMSIRSLD